MGDGGGKRQREEDGGFDGARLPFAMLNAKFGKEKKQWTPDWSGLRTVYNKHACHTHQHNL